MSQFYITENQIAPGVGSWRLTRGKSYTFQAQVSGSGAVSAVVSIEVSINREHWLKMGTITLSGTNSDADGFASNSVWPYVRANVESISGTAATVYVLCGVEQ